MKLFEYAVIYVPTEKDKTATILVQPTTVLAKDPKSVEMLAAKKIPAEYDDKLDQVQVAVRPF